MNMLKGRQSLSVVEPMGPGGNLSAGLKDVDCKIGNTTATYLKPVTELLQLSNAVVLVLGQQLFRVGLTFYALFPFFKNKDIFSCQKEMNKEECVALFLERHFYSALPAERFSSWLLNLS